MRFASILIAMGFFGSFLLGIVVSPLTARVFTKITPLETSLAVVTPPPTPNYLVKYTDRAAAVILTASVHVNARKSPYLLLILPVARSWAEKGFEVIVVLVVYEEENKPSVDKNAKEFLDLLKEQLTLIPHVQCVTFPAPSILAEISLSQVVRLFIPILMEGWPDDSYIRLSDSDMMIFQSGPFEPRNVNGIDIYNGDCCWPEVPMHSIGMQRKLWISLFEHYLPRQDDTQPWTRVAMMASIMELLQTRYNYTAAFVGHGQKFWGMDQDMAGEMVGKFKHNNSQLLTTQPMGRRAHWPFAVSPDLLECHLAGIGFGDIGRLKDTVGHLGQGLDIIAAKYNSTWLR